jgi:hypothetical protein
MQPFFWWVFCDEMGITKIAKVTETNRVESHENSMKATQLIRRVIFISLLVFWTIAMATLNYFFTKLNFKRLIRLLKIT